MNIQSSNSYLVNTNGFGADVMRVFFDKSYSSTKERLEAYMNNRTREINHILYNERELIRKIDTMNERLDKMEQKIERKQRKVYWNNEKT